MDDTLERSRLKIQAKDLLVGDFLTSPHTETTYEVLSVQVDLKFVLVDLQVLGEGTFDPQESVEVYRS